MGGVNRITALSQIVFWGSHLGCATPVVMMCPWIKARTFAFGAGPGGSRRDLPRSQVRTGEAVLSEPPEAAEVERCEDIFDGWICRHAD